MRNDSLAAARKVREFITHSNKIPDAFDAVTNYFEAATTIVKTSKPGPVEKALREIVKPRW